VKNILLALLITILLPCGAAEDASPPPTPTEPVALAPVAAPAAPASVVLVAPAAAPAVAPVEKTDWVKIVGGLLGTLITLFILPLLKNKAAEVQARATEAKFDASKSLLEQKSYLINERLMPFLWNTAAYLTEVRLPQWIDRIARRDLDGIWKDLVVELKDLAIKKFASEGLDIIAAIGEEALTGLIKRAILEKLPIPNGLREPAAFLADRVLPLLTTKGVAWVRDRVNAGEELPVPKA
jgi:hypothetical protein